MSSRGTEGLGQVYAEALADAAEAQGVLADVGAELIALARQWRVDPSLRAFFLSGAIRRDAKSATIDRVFRGKSSDLFTDFLHVLLRRNRLFTLPDAADAFDQILDAKLGRVPVTLTTAAAVEASDLSAWASRLASAIGKTPVLTHVVRPAILGGAIIRVGDMVADGSVRRHLSELRARIARVGATSIAT